MASIDRDGRIADVAVIGAMGWRRGTRLDVRLGEGLILVTADERAVFRVTDPGRVRLPASVRHWCGLIGGSRVLLVAYPEVGLLVVQPLSSLAQMITQFHAVAVRGDAA
ncbi:hypothetical protein GCM10022251_30350 [Phytohabitans flavus]|uniref:SpoVT-AbrB domain-containing protein n=1 Tax=Phytohabitans flavus TaxID=1076124 RepID=A0A6F8XXC1_9ACTN|nr:AbrB/MazE/SpoVT family DNA-binding domain-containing protein [Phytohabitans flavus]BCB78381.1 hypothetical protein Pflav_047910 [Phytohabitans flavus]